MRDLYKRLGVAKSASDSEISAAIEACQHTVLKAEAAVVLEGKPRREEYDRLHTLLCDLGRLRARLGLTHGQYWQGSVANDFSLPPDNERSRHDELVIKIGQAVSLHETCQRLRHGLPWLACAGFMTIAALVIAIGLDAL
ncbi:hypothetical protein SAMN05661010_01087 [Modicisalibacter muralis]|uniref:Uncharacterized protein n=1 Tax=Modicisalibacter muralis TaxID=119000 RepID=A0A1G9I9A9_9GAMM|nr:hypothetical protein [Halomonas muralis]SDL21413.1 hypothetical protein SAMN05661010_01087 [Halomonas muralis]